MRSIVVYVPGDPHPKERPVVVGRRAFTPPKTREYERRVGVYALQARGEWQRGRGEWPAHGVYYDVTIAYRREALRGDGDNVLKAALDGLRGVLFRDDNFRVVGRRVEQRFVGPIGTWITVTEIERPEGAPDLEALDARRPAARVRRSTAAATAASPWRGRAVLPPRGHTGGR